MLTSLLTVVTHLTETVSRENLSGLLVLEALTTKEAKAWWNSSMGVADGESRGRDRRGSIAAIYVLNPSSEGNIII